MVSTIHVCCINFTSDSHSSLIKISSFLNVHELNVPMTIDLHAWWSLWIHRSVCLALGSAAVRRPTTVLVQPHTSCSFQERCSNNGVLQRLRQTALWRHHGETVLVCFGPGNRQGSSADASWMPKNCRVLPSTRRTSVLPRVLWSIRKWYEVHLHIVLSNLKLYFHALCAAFGKWSM